MTVVERLTAAIVAAAERLEALQRDQDGRVSIDAMTIVDTIGDEVTKEFADDHC